MCLCHQHRVRPTQLPYSKVPGVPLQRAQGPGAPALARSPRPGLHGRALSAGQSHGLHLHLPLGVGALLVCLPPSPPLTAVPTSADPPDEAHCAEPECSGSTQRRAADLTASGQDL